MKKIKVFFIIPNLHGGGAQKCFVNLVNNIDILKYDITLIVFDLNGAVFLNEIKKNTKIINLNKRRVLYGLFKLYKIIKLEKPDVILSTLTQINIPMGFFKMFLFRKLVFIAREANLVSQNIKKYRFKSFWKFCYIFFYKFFDSIICISNSQADDLIKNFKTERKKINVIYNPIDLIKCNYLANLSIENKNYSIFNKESDKMYYVAVGALSKQKGFEKLIDGFNLIKNKKFQLYIIGDGPLKFQLQSKINDLKLDKKITLINFTNNPYVWIKNADFFIMSSIYEGLGTVILESISLGTPVLSLPTSGIGKEILSDIEGCYVSKENSYHSLLELINNQWGQKYKLKEKFKDTFNSKKIIKEYEQVISKSFN